MKIIVDNLIDTKGYSTERVQREYQGTVIPEHYTRVIAEKQRRLWGDFIKAERSMDIEPLFGGKIVWYKWWQWEEEFYIDVRDLDHLGQILADHPEWVLVQRYSDRALMFTERGEY